MSSQTHPDSNQLPVIDISGLAEGCQASLQAVARQIRDATDLSGFFYVSGHGISDGTIANLRSASRQFFALGDEQKRKIAINQVNRGYLGSGEARMKGAEYTDLKEVYFWGRELSPDDPDLLAGVAMCGPNQWPDEPGNFHACVMAYNDALQRAGDQVLRAIAVSLGSAPEFFEPFYRRSMLRGQLIHYPAPPPDAPSGQFGVAPHSDFGCITLLLQETAGLEVLARSGEWIAAPPLPGTLVVNIGDLLERWSNLHLPSTRHRVRNTTGDGRYSIAMFYDPSPRAIVDPRALCPAEEPKFEPIESADYILDRNKASFAHFEKEA